MNRAVYLTFLYCLTFILLGGNVYSNQKNDTSATLYTLSDLCQIACESAEQIKISENDFFIARQDKKRALSVLMPRATAFGSYLSHNKPDQFSPDVNSYGIKLNQTFTLNGKELIALHISEDTIDEKEFSLRAVKAEYLLLVAQAYYQILSTSRYVEIAETDVKRLEKHRHAVNERLKVGQVTKTALFRADAELSGARTSLIKSSNGLKLAKATLQRLVEIDENFDLSQAQINKFKNFSYSYEELKKTALNRRAEILAAEKNLEIAKKNIKYTKGAYWPTLSVEGTYSNAEIEFDEPIHGTDDAEDSSINATLTFTMFDGGLRAADVRQALANQRKAALALTAEKKGIILETKSVWLDYQTAISVLSTLKDELKSARENFNAVTMQFKYGMADSVDMMDANTLLVKAQRELSDADYNCTLSVLGIMRTRGDIVSVLTGSH